jgi:uncharacterized protein YndB with AHSA1/START domain
VAPAVAFDVFTRELDAWWGHGPAWRFVAPYGGTLTLEPRVGGRLLHVAAPGVSFVVGAVEVWEPPRRLALTWRLTNFTPEQQTRVEVRFDPAPEGTRVSVTHSGWDGIPASDPARHGMTNRAFVLFRGHWWAQQLAAAKQHIEGSRAAAGKDIP